MLLDMKMNNLLNLAVHFFVNIHLNSFPYLYKTFDAYETHMWAEHVSWNVEC